MTVYFALLFFVVGIVHSARISPIITSQTNKHKVKTNLGNIVGKSCVHFPEVTEYLGIPFASPPVGDLRFKKPVPYSISYPSSAFQATKSPPACGSFCGAIGSTDFDSVLSSEDCLYLNLWAPAKAQEANASLPVRVYMHGGYTLACSASDPYLNGCNYAYKTESIIVNIQFRKGPFGFLAHPKTFEESNTTGNWAILDQQLALQWVQDNIEAFGGDPKKVLINGNSAGGQFVEFQLVSPSSKGLFHSAISQSPPCVHLLSKAEAYNVTRQFMTDVGCEVQQNKTKELECLRDASWATLFSKAAEVSVSFGLAAAECESLSYKPYFQAVVDGTVFPSTVKDALRTGNFHQVPYVVGFAAQEGTHYMDSEDVTNATFTEMLERYFPGADLKAMEALYPRESFFDTYDTEKTRTAALFGDVFLVCPIYERLVDRTKGANSLNYLYTWEVTPSCPTSEIYLGPTHGTEILFTYGIVNQIYPPWGTCDFSQMEVDVSNDLLVTWKSMAADGYPKTGNGSVWLQWTPEDQLGTYLTIHGAEYGVIDVSRKCSVIEATRTEALEKLGIVANPVSSQ